MTRFCSIFSQLLQLFPRTDFQQAVVATKAERHARGFTCWGQFVGSHHKYAPPAAFCSALRASPPVNSSEYFSRLHENGWPEKTGTFRPRPPNRRLHPTALGRFVSRFVKRRG